RVRELDFIQVLSFHILAHSFALSCTCAKLNSFIFKRFRTLCTKHPGVGGCVYISATPREAECKPGGASVLLIDVVLCLKSFEQRLEKRLGRVGGSADGLRHFLRGGWEVTRVRRDPCQRQGADPMIRVLLRNLGKQFKCPLGVARSLQAASVRVELNRTGFVERFGKHFGGFFL